MRRHLIGGVVVLSTASGNAAGGSGNHLLDVAGEPAGAPSLQQHKVKDAVRRAAAYR